MKKTLLLLPISMLAATLLILSGCEKDTPVKESAQKAEKQAKEMADKNEGEVPEETLVEETTEELYEKDKGPDKQAE